MQQEKVQAQKLWNKTPCGTGDYLKEHEYGSLAFFDEVRRHRYEVTDRWMPRTIDFGAARGKKLLEIGHGMGTDLLTFADNGAEVYGIDITQEHHRLAKLNFELHGRNCTIKLCDAAKIDFPSNYFDMVYSHGVLHHTPDIEQCISEAHRVLKPGGKFVLALYHTWSLPHLYMILRYGIGEGRLFKLGYSGLMASMEGGADGLTIKPMVKTYSKRQVIRLLKDFPKVELRLAHSAVGNYAPIRRFFPESLEQWLDRRVGWYVIASATK